LSVSQGVTRRRSAVASGRWVRTLSAAGMLLAALITSGATPAPAGTLARAATPTPACSSLQALVDAAPAGSTVTAPACMYRETVTINKPLTLRGHGATISGKDVAGTTVRSAWVVVNASDVTLEGFTMRDANNAAQTGAVTVKAGISRFALRACDLGYAAGANVSIGVANASVIEDCTIHHGGQLGVHMGGDSTNGQNNVVRNNRIYANNTAGFDPGWEAGGLKATRQVGLRLEGNDVYDNAGPGLWCDVSCRGTLYRGNRVHDNSRAGIFDEVSYDGRIEENIVWGNGTDPSLVWGWPAGILVSSSRATLVTGNTVAWNPVGISVVSQDRRDEIPPPGDIQVIGNVVVGAAGSRLVGWFEDWAGSLHDGTNRGIDNSYWVPDPEPAACRFEWRGCLSTLAAFAATPGGGGAYLTDTAKDAALAAAGIPSIQGSRAEPRDDHRLTLAAVMALLLFVSAAWGAAMANRARTRGPAA